jgi:23S rRNA pseudouridine1911/1915/1917 synthase
MSEFIADDDERGQRLDVAVTAHINVLSRASVHKLSEQDRITVNGEKQKISYKLRGGDKVEVDYDSDELKEIPDVEIDVIYEDDNCVVINKQIGLLTHSKGAFNPEATVATWLERRGSSQPVVSNTRNGIVHRLDRATSGVMICAKNDDTLVWLQKQFSLRKAKKTYIAIVEGVMEPEKAVIDMPIERNPKAPQTFRVGANGKPAVTAYETKKISDNYSLLQLSPQTGRTHQLRVHLNSQKHPIVGDLMYDGKKSDRLYLHALSLELTLPNHVRKVFTAPLPPEFEKLMS